MNTTADTRTTIMVTGAGGYIGSVACQLFLQKGLSIVAVDNFSHGYKQPLELLQKQYGPERIRIYTQDLLDDFSPVFDSEPDIELVVNYAAVCKVSESMDEPEKYFTINTTGTNNLLTQMMKRGIRKMVFSSTCATYGESEYVPIDEDHPTRPENPYGESKLLVEQMMKWYAKQDKLDFITLRYFNICGASDDGTIGDSKKPSVHMMQNAVRGALGIEPFYLTCPQVDTPDKTPIRDYINVVDLNEAHYLAIQYLLGPGDAAEAATAQPGDAAEAAESQTGDAVQAAAAQAETQAGNSSEAAAVPPDVLAAAQVETTQDTTTRAPAKPDSDTKPVSDPAANRPQSHIINLGTGTGNSVLEIVKKVQEVTGTTFDFTQSEPRKGESAKLIAAIGKAERILGWKPKRSIEDSVRSLVTWYKQHPHGWEY